MKKYTTPIFIVALVLILDQALKFYIKLTMTYGHVHFLMGDRFYMHFLENPGMAFGMTLGGDYGKLALSLFRIIAVFAIGYYLTTLIGKKSSKGLIISISMIFAGAIGNIIDSIFYGVIFSPSTPDQVATLFPTGGGYSTWFHGKVVDMIVIHVFTIDLPSWIPKIGGQPFVFFGPIFNIADAAITIGVLLIVIFQKNFFKEDDAEDEKSEATKEPAQHDLQPLDQGLEPRTSMQ